MWAAVAAAHATEGASQTAVVAALAAVAAAVPDTKAALVAVATSAPTAAHPLQPRRSFSTRAPT